MCTLLFSKTTIFFYLSLWILLSSSVERSLSCLSLFLCLSHSRFFFFSLATRYDYSWLFLQHARKEKSKRRSRGTLVPKIVTCSRAFDHFLLYKKKGRRRKTGGEGHLFSHFSLLIYRFCWCCSMYLFFFVFFVKVKSRGKAHFQSFQGKKEWNFDGGGRAKKREFCVQEFFFWSFFFVFWHATVVYVWQTTNDDSIRGAPFLYHNPQNRRIV